MANSYRRGCGCQRTRYGVLNTVPQTSGYHCGVTYPCNYPCNYPFYTGPCAPGSTYDSPDYPMPCGTGACPNGCWMPGFGTPAYGMFSANLPIATAAGAAIPLLVSGESSGDFDISGGVITIPDEGLYLAIYSFNAPQGTTVNTSLSLALNGGSIPASALPVVTSESTATAANHIGFSIFRANQNATLTLNSTTALALEQALGAQNTFTLALYQLC